MRFLRSKRWKYKKFEPASRLPEPLIQGEIYKVLRERGIECTLGASIFCEGYGGELTPDVAILREGYVIGIIEVKSFKKPKAISNQIINNLNVSQIKSKQLKRYLLYELPLYYCTSWDDVPNALIFAELCVREFEESTAGKRSKAAK